MAVTGLAYSYTLGSWIFSLTLILVGAPMQNKRFLPMYKTSFKHFIVPGLSRRSQTLVLSPRQLSRSENMGSHTPTLHTLAPKREFGARCSENS